jgi:Xaa-Pro dipeptidase
MLDAEALAALDGERWRRIFDAVARPTGENPLDGLLLTHVGDVTAVAGYSPVIERGQSPFSWLDPVALLWANDGLLIVPDQEEGGARTTNLLPAIASYPGYVFETPFDHQRRLTELVVGGLAAHLPRRGATLGIQPETLPAGLAGTIAAAFPRLRLVDVTTHLAWTRAVKDEAEIVRLRHAFAVADVMHAELRRVLRTAQTAGMSEIELYSAAKAAGERQIGGRMALHADLIAGPRTAETGGNPGSRVLRDGDLVMADVAPRVDGYWADTCSATVVGTPSEEQRRVSGIVRAALEQGIERAQPGTPAADLDRFLRKEMRSAGFAYPHHSGHGVGATFHDEPRIVPYEQRPLAEGMVICLEPGAYVAGWGGIRWEVGLVVRAGGPEVLSHFPLELDAAG